MSDKQCAKIAIYDRQGDVRQLYLYWVEKTNKVVTVEDGAARTILMKEEATVLDALHEIGYTDKMSLELYAPHYYSIKELLAMPLSIVPFHRIVLLPKGVEIAGNPFVGM